MAAQLDRLQAHYHGSCTFGIPSKNRTKRNETGQQKEKLGKGKGATNIWSRSAFVGAKHTHTTLPWRNQVDQNERPLALRW